MKLHHIGIATEDIEKTKEYCKKVYKVINETEIVYDEKQTSNLCMLTLEDGSMIELIQGERVNSFVEKKQYIYHLCYQVEDIVDKIREFRENGGIIMSQPKPAVLFGGKEVAFVYTQIGIIELLQE